MAAISKLFQPGMSRPATGRPVSGWTETARSLQTPPQGAPALQVDSCGDGPLVQVGPAAQLLRGQPHHSHHRHAAIEHDANVGSAVHGHRLEDRMAHDALLDDDPVGLARQGVEPGEDRGQVIGHVGEEPTFVAGVDKFVAVVADDDHDAASLAAAGRLDDELLAVADQVEKLGHVAVPLDQGVGFRDGDLTPVANLLGEVTCRPRADNGPADCRGARSRRCGD